MSPRSNDPAERSPLLPKSKTGKRALVECHEIPRWTRRYILVALWLGTFFCNVNLTMVSTLLPSITSEFKGSNHASWIGTAYLLSSCTFTPLYGRLCTILGRRVACQIALIAVSLGTLFCGISSNMVELTVARFIAGIGAGALQLLAMIVSADMYSLRQRGLPQAMGNFSQAVGLGLGGPLGGIINDLFGWRVAFLFQVPLFILVMIILTKTLHYTTPGQSRSAKEVLSRIDFGGLIILFLLIGSILTCLSMKYNEDLPWADPQVIIPSISSLLSFGLLFIVECCVASEPILPPYLLREKVPVLTSLSNYFVGFGNFCIMYFIPLWFQTVSLDSASIAGLHLLPHSLAMGLGSLIAGWVIHRTGKYTTLDLVFGLLPVIGFIPIIFMRDDSWAITKWFSVFPVGFGNAVVFMTVLIALQANLSESSIALGTAVLQLFRGLGQISSVAFASAVFQSRLDAELRKRIHVPHAEKVISEIRRSFSRVRSLPPDLQRAAREAYSASLSAVFIIATVTLIIGCIVRFPIPEGGMDGGNAGERSECAERSEVESELLSDVRQRIGSSRP